MNEQDKYQERPPLEPIVPPLQLNGVKLYGRMTDKYSTLHQAQKEALKAVLRWFSDEKKNKYTAVVVMPTGTGKTGVICCLPYAMGSIAPEKIDMGKPVLIIAPGLTILEQLKDNLIVRPFLEKVKVLTANETSKYNYSVHTVENTKSVEALTKIKTDIVLSNSQKWRKEREGKPNYEDLPKDLFSMVIVDEAHRLPSPQWEEIVNKFRGHAKTVFFTATPDREDKKSLTTDGSINTYGFAYELTRKKAIDKHLIREVKQYPAQPPPKKESTSGSSWEHCVEDVIGAVEKRLRYKNANLFLPDGKKHAAIIIAKNIIEAEKVKEICTKFFEKEKVVVVHSQASQDAKTATENITKDKYQIVIIVKMLIEGFDYPPFSIAGIVTKIRSAVKFTQFIGRIQRLVRGSTEIESGIIGDIITHDYFEQEELIERFNTPLIPKEKEDETIDKDEDEEDQNVNEC